MKTKAIIANEAGSPKVLKWQDIDLPEMGDEDVLIRQTAVGLNYIDVYHRSGLYPPPNGFPFIPGMEGAGIIEKVGSKVEGFKEGQKVCYVSKTPGAYTKHRVINYQELLLIPEGLTEAHTASILLKGMTAQYLIRRLYRIDEKSVILLHAAAGGVGNIICQWAKAIGATVIGTVGSDEKAEYVKKLGCNYPINYKKEDFVKKVMEITNGRGVDVVYDSVGKDTILKSIECVRPVGFIASYGQSSGAVPPIDLSLLAKKSSFITRPSLFHYTALREEYVLTAADLFNMILKGNIKIEVGQSFYLHDAAEAHKELEARNTKGASVFFVD